MKYLKEIKWHLFVRCSFIFDIHFYTS